MEIGVEQPSITIEPLEEPVPHPEPAPKEPELVPEPEKVGTR